MICRWDKPEVIRYLESMQYKYKKTYKAIWQTTNWRIENLPVKFDPFLQEILVSNNIYIYIYYILYISMYEIYIRRIQGL